jgi:hypothetical protein
MQPQTCGIPTATRAVMIDVALTVLALLAGGISIELYAASWR